jgi:hypothetical protein
MPQRWCLLAASTAGVVLTIGGAGARAAGRDACALLSGTDATAILGVTIERVETKAGTDASTCNYYAKPVPRQARQQDVAKRFFDIAKGGKEPDPGADPSAVARQTGLGDLVKSVGAAAADPAAPYVSITVAWRGGRAQLATFKGVVAANSPGLKTTEALRGIGDDAVLGPLDSVLMFVKGDVSVSIGLGTVPEARAKGIAMARAIAGRL